MAFGLKLPLHGRAHLETGADPIPGIGSFIRYVFKNIGDWLSVETDAYFDTGPGAFPLARSFGGAGVAFMDAGHGILLSSGDGGGGHPQRSEMMFSSGQFIYYLDGGDDLGYLEGGSLLRYSGGGNIIFYTTDGGLPGAGDFLVYTTGSSDSVAGDIQLDASGGDGNGAVTLGYGDNTTLEIQQEGAVLMRFASDGTIHIKTGATIIADL